ncbi:MAG: transaldolase [Parcubacteria group bacterium Gr01-1014_17]|nr:MAG: transaldolase [Parcubacteria group bacterium Gr01-1014_17]
MKLFLDSANLGEIKEALESGLILGITTNPSLLSKEPKGSYLTHMKDIVSLLKKDGRNLSLSVEVFSEKPEEMFKQAREFKKALKYKNLAIKIPVNYKGQSYLGVVRQLSDEGVMVNCTACMTPLQLSMAAAAGARFVSLFYNRVRDGAKDTEYEAVRKEMLEKKDIEQADFEPNNVLREARALLAPYPKAEIIAGSIRSVLDIKEAGLAGAHIVTASFKTLKAALTHFKTDHAVGNFLNDFKQWCA